MKIPPELQDRLIEVLRTAHDNAVEIHQDAQERYKGYKQTRIDLLSADVEDAKAVLDAVLALKGEQEQQQKPVAWMYQCSADSSGPVLMQHKKDWAESASGLWTETPLYTSPQAQPAREPMTDEQPVSSADELPKGFIPLQQENGTIVYAACLDRNARHYKWLMWKHPDGQWVSKRKLEEWEVMQAEDQEHYGIILGTAAHGITSGEATKKGNI